MATTIEVAIAVVAYMGCSSSALVTNKLTIHHFPLPGGVFCLQIMFTVAVVHVGRRLGLIEADPLEWENVKRFALYVASFVLCLYSSGRALAVSNVETVIVWRSASPLAVCVLDWLFMGHELPSLRSTMALLGVLLGAIGYVLEDSEFKAKGISAYGWILLNVAMIVFEMLWGKRMMNTIKFTSPVWGSVLYVNALSLFPMALFAVAAGEAGDLHKVGGAPQAYQWLALSCVIGVGISWAGWNCRSKISATSFTLLGVVCKFLSVLLNVAIWDKHATPRGLAMLALCLVCSSLYKQAPKKSDHPELPLTCPGAAKGEIVGSVEASPQEDETSEVNEVNEEAPLASAAS